MCTQCAQVHELWTDFIRERSRVLLCASSLYSWLSTTSQVPFALVLSQLHQLKKYVFEKKRDRWKGRKLHLHFHSRCRRPSRTFDRLFWRATFGFMIFLNLFFSCFTLGLFSMFRDELRRKWQSVCLALLEWVVFWFFFYSYLMFWSIWERRVLLDDGGKDANLMHVHVFQVCRERFFTILI